MAGRKPTLRRCLILNCPAQTKGGLGYCGLHYQRYTKYGDPLYCKVPKRKVANSYIKESVGYIDIGKGRFATVDIEDFDRVNEHLWRVGDNGYGIFYVKTTIKRRSIYLHRFIMNALPGVEVDHNDWNPWNNRRFNLTIVTHAENSQNRPLRKTNTSGHVGASWDNKRKRWAAQIRRNGKGKFLGYFKDAKEAGAAYQKAALKMGYVPKNRRP